MGGDETSRTALVTGGGSGIGAAVCRRLAQDGVAVAALDLDGATAQATAETVEAAGGRATGVAADVTDRASIDAALGQVTERLGRPTILVTSAGLTSFEPFLDVDVAMWRRVLDVNLTGTFHCCQALLPGMLEEGWGRIVTISSSSIHSGVPGMTSYVAAKTGVVGLTKSLALEFAPHGITVNTVPPGFIDTPMLRGAEAEGSLSVERSLASTPVGRVGRGEDIAAACAFLARDEASYITGQIIGVNGGRNT